MIAGPKNSATAPAPASQGPKGSGVAPSRPLSEDREDAADRAEHARHEDDLRQHRPAEPGAERGEQLEVAVPHALLAADQLEQPVHGPQHEVAGDRADHRARERHEQPEQVGGEPGPEQRQREVVGQELRVGVDERERDQRPQQHAGGEALRRRAEGPDRRERGGARRRARPPDSAARCARCSSSSGPGARARRRPARSRSPAARARRTGRPNAARRGCRRGPASGSRPASSAHCSVQPRSIIRGRRWMTTLRKLPTRSPEHGGRGQRDRRLEQVPHRVARPPRRA